MKLADYISGKKEEYFTQVNELQTKETLISLLETITPELNNSEQIKKCLDSIETSNILNLEYAQLFISKPARLLYNDRKFESLIRDYEDKITEQTKKGANGLSFEDKNMFDLIVESYEDQEFNVHRLLKELMIFINITYRDHKLYYANSTELTKPSIEDD